MRRTSRQWAMTACDGWPGLVTVSNGDGNIIAAAVTEDDARLIAAAPELLEKLADLLNACDKQMFNGGVTEETLTAMEQARAIIVKLMTEEIRDE